MVFIAEFLAKCEDIYIFNLTLRPLEKKRLGEKSLFLSGIS